MDSFGFLKIKGIGALRVIKIDNKMWFVGKDICKALGYSSHRCAILRHCKDYKGYDYPINNIMQYVNIVSENDVYCLISQSNLLSVNEKEKIIKNFNAKGYLKSVTFSSRPEIEFLDALEEVLKQLNIKGIRQYRIGKYKIDYYIESLNLAIEYDEDNHNGYTYEQQELRQQRIEDKLKCKFIRLSDSETNYYNIGIVIKNIINKKYKGE